MKGSLRQMWTCHWSARRIQRYLDSDPAAPLTPGEVARLEEHLAVCDKCTQVAAEHRALRRAWAAWPGRRVTDPAAVDRLRVYLTTITEQPPHDHH
jgi:anti-sigma factor RsiW